MAEAIPALEIRNLHKRYGDLEVLKGISLTARDGDVISILGSSGSGKSTFLRCINLLENPHEGEITVAGEQLKLKRDKQGDTVAADGKQLNRIRSELGFVFQNFNLWPHATILDNIIGRRAACWARARPKPPRWPKPCWPRSASPTSATSTQSAFRWPAAARGDRPHAGDAAKVILFDEPTSALDPEMVQKC